MKMMLSAMRGLHFEGAEFQFAPENLDLDSLIPFRHKIEREYAHSMRSSFAPSNVGYESVAAETDLVYYQL